MNNLIMEIDKICRICLQCGDLVSMYSLHQYNALLRPIDMFDYCIFASKINNNENIRLPTSICNECLLRLNITYQFLQQYETSYLRLTELICIANLDGSDGKLMSVKNASIGKDDDFIYSTVCNIFSDHQQNNQQTIPIDQTIHQSSTASTLFEQHQQTSKFPTKLHSQEEHQQQSSDLMLQIQNNNDYYQTYLMPSPTPLSGISTSIQSNNTVTATTVSESVKTNVRTMGPGNKEKRKKGSRILKTKADLDKFLALKRSSKRKEQNCGKSSKKVINNLTDGNSTVVLKEPEKCPECGKSFLYNGYLAAHMRIHTGERPYECDICNCKFSQIGNLMLHKRKHTGERPYQCELCSKFFTTSSNLKAHQRIHSDVRDYKCLHCPRAFKSTSELISHSGIHTGVKNHVCRICGKAFYKTSYLNVHIRTIHQGEKRHRCSECGKEFSNRSNLICHFRIHTGEKPFTCKICNTKFNQSSALMRHSKQHSKSPLKRSLKDLNLSDQLDDEPIEPSILPAIQSINGISINYSNSPTNEEILGLF